MPPPEQSSSGRQEAEGMENTLKNPVSLQLKEEDLATIETLSKGLEYPPPTDRGRMWPRPLE